MHLPATRNIRTLCAYLFASPFPSLKFRENIALKTFEVTERTFDETWRETFETSLSVSRSTSPSGLIRTLLDSNNFARYKMSVD